MPRHDLATRWPSLATANALSMPSLTADPIAAHAGVVVRQPVQDGEAAAYDILLADGRRLVINEDSDHFVRAGDPRAVSSFELIFAGSKVRKPHDDALAAMTSFGKDVQLVDNMGPPEVVGRMVAQLKIITPGAPSQPPADDALYEKTLEAAAGLIGSAVPADWREQRAALVQEHWPPTKKRPRGRPPAGGPKEPAFFCPVAGCDKAYASYGGLYLHKRAYHPELINSEKKQAAGAPAGTPGRKSAGSEKEPTYFCPAEGCNKAYGSYGGLYLHKRSHHPELISKPAPKTEEEKEEAKKAKEALRAEAAAEKKAIKDHRDMMPKKPLTAYVHYCNEVRPQLKVEHPDMPGPEIMKIINERWTLLQVEDKARFEGLYQAEVQRFRAECVAAGIDPDATPPPPPNLPLPAPKRARLEAAAASSSSDAMVGVDAVMVAPKPKPKPRKKKKADDDDDGEPAEVLPWAIPDGFSVSDKPAAELLVPGAAEAKALVGRTVLYHWDGVGWCSGVIEKANGDKSKTVDGETANFLVYYEMDDDLSRHVLELGSYAPDGPPNSWVLLEVQEIVGAVEVVSAVDTTVVDTSAAAAAAAAASSSDAAAVATEAVAVEAQVMPVPVDPVPVDPVDPMPMPMDVVTSVTVNLDQ